MERAARPLSPCKEKNKMESKAPPGVHLFAFLGLMQS